LKERRRRILTESVSKGKKRRIKKKVKVALKAEECRATASNACPRGRSKTKVKKGERKEKETNNLLPAETGQTVRGGGKSTVCGPNTTKGQAERKKERKSYVAVPGSNLRTAAGRGKKNKSAKLNS